MSFVPFLQAGNPGATSGTPSLLVTLIPFILIIVIFYFFLIRPQNKKQKETEKMLNALKKGDKIITIGGIHGVISSVKEQSVIVKVDEDCKVEFNRSAIASVELSDAEKAKIAEEAEARRLEAEAKKLAKKNKKSSKKAKAVEEAKPEAAAETKEDKKSE